MTVKADAADALGHATSHKVPKYDRSPETGHALALSHVSPVSAKKVNAGFLQSRIAKSIFTRPQSRVWYDGDYQRYRH